MYTMKDVCNKTGMTYETLKYYCNEGLIPNVQRNANNQRIFSEKQLNWANSLICLKRCGMSIQEMKMYLGLCLEGEKSIVERKKLLLEKKEQLLDKIAELELSIDYIDRKEKFYDDVLDGKVAYHSNLIMNEDEYEN